MCLHYMLQSSLLIIQSDVKILVIKMYFDGNIFFELSNIWWCSEGGTAAECWWNKAATRYVLCKIEF